MNKVYLVTSGTYSDYKVIAVFSGSSIAKEVAEKFRYGTVLEMEVNPQIILPTGLKRYDYFHDEQSKFPDEQNRLRECKAEYLEDLAEGSHVIAAEGGNVYYGTIWARDEAHAWKIIGEKLKELAEAEALTPAWAKAMAYSELRGK